MILDALAGTRTAADIPAAEFSEVLRINALSVFLALKYAVPAMEKTSTSKPHSGGSIISTASVAGVNANGGPLPYSATKAAVINMTKNAAFEVAGKNIRVNCICPGLIKTDMTKLLFELAELAGAEEGLGALAPLNRHGMPEGESYNGGWWREGERGGNERQIGRRVWESGRRGEEGGTGTATLTTSQRSARRYSGSRPMSPAS